MTDLPSADDLAAPRLLAEAEVIARAVSPLNWWAGLVMAEYDKRGAALANEMSLLDRYERRGEELARLRLVEQAATALVEHNDGIVPLGAYEYREWCNERDRRLHALAAAVHGETK